MWSVCTEKSTNRKKLLLARLNARSTSGYTSGSRSEGISDRARKVT
jgi:hypothetical protein